jgi:two-component system OmpR family sensor kinase
MAGASGGAADSPLPAELARLLHDLRGPLNSAVMHLEVLKRTVAGDPTADASLRTVLQQLARLSDMLPAAVGIAALEPRHWCAHDLRALAERARDAGGHASVSLGSGPWPRVSGDEALLVRAIGELMANAMEATPSGAPGPEVMATAGADGEAMLTVRDHGTGLRTTNPKLLIRLLQTSKAGHQGLGLVTVERVARLHGGGLEFESLSDGARVTLRLPAAGSDARHRE